MNERVVELSGAFDVNTALLVIGAAAAAYWLTARAEDRAPLDPLLAALVVLVPGYILFQLIPLPAFLLDGLSPARARLVNLVDAVADSRGAPLSVDPSATLAQLVGAVGCVVTFLLVRDLAWQSRERFAWATVLPLVAIGVLEAIVGLAQGAMRADVRGTLASSASFAGVLEAALPLAIAGGIALTFRPSARRPIVFVRRWAGVATLCVVILLLAAILQSGSRMGVVAALSGLLAMGAVSVTTRVNRRTRKAVLVGLLAACAFVGAALPVDRVLGTFASSNDVATARRVLPVWGDTLRLIADYPLTGTGLGAFEAAFPKYQTTTVETTVAFAGSDYLQLFAELGLLGALLVLALLLTAHRRAARAAVTCREWNVRLLHIGCTGAITAIGVHSLVDFNLHVPANALMLAWIAGVAVSVPTNAALSTLSKRWMLTPAYALVLLALVGACRKSPTVSEALCRIGVCGQTLMAADAGRDSGSAAHVPAALGVVVRTPTSAAAWCDLGDAMFSVGRVDEARTAFANAVALAPNRPPVRARVADFYFRLGDVPRALIEGATALASSEQSSGRIFDMYLRWGVPVDTVLSRGLSPGPTAARAYLRDLIHADRHDAAAAAWSWTTAHQYADGALARDFVRYLFARGDYEQAARSWAGYVGATGYVQSSFVFDGGFELAPSGTEFDWQLGNLDEDHVVVSLDPQVARSGNQSLRIRFGGDNIDYHHTRQVVFVTPGVYTFSAMVRAMGVTTDRGVSFHLYDSATPRNIDLWTPEAIGTTGWTALEKAVTVPRGVSLLTVEIARVKSGQSDSHIAGTLWVDDVTLTRIAN
jgi:O-antigen ligase